MNKGFYNVTLHFRNGNKPQSSKTGVFVEKAGKLRMFLCWSLYTGKLGVGFVVTKIVIFQFSRRYFFLSGQTRSLSLLSVVKRSFFESTDYERVSEFILLLSGELLFLYKPSLMISSHSLKMLLELDAVNMSTDAPLEFGILK